MLSNSDAIGYKWKVRKGRYSVRATAHGRSRDDDLPSLIVCVSLDDKKVEIWKQLGRSKFASPLWTIGNTRRRILWIGSCRDRSWIKPTDSSSWSTLPSQGTALCHFLSLAGWKNGVYGTHHLFARDAYSSQNAKFHNPMKKEQQLSNAKCCLSILNKGEAVLFYARALHCGNANDLTKGSTQALLNFSFGNPENYRRFGICVYYVKMTLEDVADALLASGVGESIDPFLWYGDGLVLNE